MKIKNIFANEILDSRGNPTLEVFLETDDGEFSFGVPSGASTGMYEAVELRDGGDRFFGKGVLKAKENIEKIIAPELKGFSLDQKKIDKKLLELDGTENKSVLGANAILGVSVAVCKAASFANELPLYDYISTISGQKTSLPRPLFNVVNGGSHTGGGGVDFQEFMIAPNNNSFKENLFEAAKVYHLLGKLLKKKNPLWKNIGDEGGYVPEIASPKEVLQIIQEVTDSEIVLDVAATEFFADDLYKTKMGDMTTDDLINYYAELVSIFPVIGIEDPLQENDFVGWSKLRNKLDKTIIIGDDLIVTNPSRIKTAIENNSCNGMILKINQIGTITESIEAMHLAKENNWDIVVSHRSGETTDTFISDFAVGIGARFIKSGAPARGERVVKYNRLLEIEQELE